MGRFQPIKSLLRWWGLVNTARSENLQFDPTYIAIQPNTQLYHFEINQCWQTKTALYRITYMKVDSITVNEYDLTSVYRASRYYDYKTFINLLDKGNGHRIANITRVTEVFDGQVWVKDKLSILVERTPLEIYLILHCRDRKCAYVCRESVAEFIDRLNQERFVLLSSEAPDSKHLTIPPIPTSS